MTPSRDGCRRDLVAQREHMLRRWIGAGFLLAASAAVSLFPASADERTRPAGPEKRVGQFVRITFPITDRVRNHVRRAVDTVVTQAKQRGEWPVLVFELAAGRSEYGAAYDMARYLSSDVFNGATTVAYVPETLTGHAVLVALACDQIVMHPDAELGDAGRYDAVIEPSVRSAYVEIAAARKTVPTDVALGMLDAALEIHVVETDVSREFVAAERLAELRKQKSFQSSKVLIAAGKPGLFTGEQARELGLASYLSVDRMGVAKALGLPREAIQENPSLDGGWRPVRVDVKGPVTPQLADQIQKMIQNEIRDRDANFICLWIDSAGGSAADSTSLAMYLADLDSDKRRTVAYIPREARGDAAYIALACDQIVMHPEAVLGGPGASEIDKKDIPVHAQTLRELARRKYRSPSLAAAMVDPDRTVYQYTRQTDARVEYYSEDDLRELPDGAQWKQGPAVTERGRALRLSGRAAEQWQLAGHTVEDFNQFKQLYGLEHDPALVEPGWADVLIDALNSPGVSMFLLLLGIAALYAELQAPGIGLGGLIATVCFLLYFWSGFLGGTAGWLEVLLFVAGVVCLLIEIFVLPGFGVFGLGGALMVITSLVLASQTFVIPRNEYQFEQFRNSLLILVGAGVGTAAAVMLVHRLLPRTPGVNRMVLAPPSGDELSELARRESLAVFDDLLGASGSAVTPLVPSGKAKFGEQVVDVIADGDFIDRGQAVEVIQVRGNRVLVRPIDTRHG